MEVEASLIGRTLATRYRIERCIGRGGMATVFAARVESGERAGNEVALKIVNRELTRDPTVLRRFHREAKAASRLKHPNTVEVYEYGVDGDDAYIAMELAPGTDLLQALAAENPMRQARAAFIVSHVCAGLAAAHAQGIIHRDLKPENVMLIPDASHPGGERVKVLDFGIAKIMESSKASGEDDQPSYVTKTALTRVGTIVGTPAYMSPEQCRGGELDGRSDVYSCGVLLYQLLTGEVPFTGETPLHTAMRHIHAQPKPPHELRRDLAPELEKIVLKALAKWPGERHQTADALRDELDAILRGLPDAASLNLPAAPVVIGSAGSANAAHETELFIPSDPRMENGALGAGKLGSVRLGSLGALQSRPASAAPPAAKPSTASADKVSPTKSAPPAKSPPAIASTRPASALGQGVSLGRGASLGRTPASEARPESPRRPIAVAQPPAVKRASAPPVALAPLETPTDTRTDGPLPATQQRSAPPAAARGFSRPGTDESAAPRVTAKGGFARTTASGARSGREGENDPPTLQKQEPKERRPTETGLTPTAQISRDKVLEHEEAALANAAPAKSPVAEDDDEPQTFIRAPQPGLDGGFEPYPEERPAHKTLVMDEPKRADPSAASPRVDAAISRRPVDPSTNARAMAPTVDAPLDSARRNAIDNAWDEMSRKVHVGREAQGLAPPSASAGSAALLPSGDYPSMLQSGQRLGDLTSSSAMLPRAQLPPSPGPGASQPLRPLQLPPTGPASAQGGAISPRGPQAFTPNAQPGLAPTAAMPMQPPASGTPASRPMGGPLGRDEFGDVSSVSMVGPLGEGFGAVKSTIRLAPEAIDAARNPYPVGANRKSDKRGLRAKLEELSGAVLLLIGIAVGLFIALIGLMIVIFTR